jgi:hypothetical protein
MTGQEMLERFAGWYEALERQVDTTENPRQRAILQTYFQHLALEFSGDVPAAMADDMMVEEPYYFMRFEPGEGLEFHGRTGVTEFYSGMFAAPVLCTGGWNAVADWGVLSLKDIVQFLPGATVAVLGVDVDDPEAIYTVACPVVVRWPFDSRARLAGEECWQLEPYRVHKADPADVLTIEQIASVAKRFIR